MAIGRIIVLSALVAQALSAPSGCIESCNFLQTSIHQTSSGYQNHANLVQGKTNLNDHDYARPGNWTEHNQYHTDGGHGKVHEERGQYVEGSKRVRYYKKNFTASYGTGNVNEMDLGTASSGQHRYDSIHAPSNQYIDSQSAYGLGQSVIKETGYNRMHSQQTQSLSSRIDSKSERLEDFGEYDRHSQVSQHIPSIDTQTIDTQHHIDTPDNWNKVNSYNTDGGRGHVFEEEGQYVTGPKKIRYYKKNYTSSYSSSIPQSSIPSVTELHNELQRNLQKDLNSIRNDLHQISSTGHTAATTHVGSTLGLTQEAVGFHDLQTAESDSYRQHSGYQGVPSTGNVHHYTDQQQRETLTDVRHQLPYTYPSAATNTYGTENHRTYQSHETHSSRVLPVSQPSHLSSSYVQVPTGNYQTSYHNTHSSGHHLDETRRAEVLGTHQSSVLQNQLLTDSQRVYNPHSSHVTYPNGHGETRRYEEHWRSTSHTGGNVAPERTIADHAGYHDVAHTERAHYDRDAYNEHGSRYHTAQGYESRARTSGSSYDSAYRASSGQLVTGSLDLGHASHGADCTEETHQQYQHETRHRKYKRDDQHVQQHQTIDNKHFTQQNQEFGQEMEDLTQQSEQFTQQTEGSDDFTQQTGKLEFGQQTDDQHLDDLTQHSEQLTQQTEGQFEFGQQTVNNPHLEDLTQQTQETDLSQQLSGKLEFGQQTVGSQHLDDLTQQSEQFTQQTQGSDDFTQQTGKLEFGQQTDDQHLDDLTQHSEQLTQQTEGQFEFGQQTVNNPHSEDLTQQTQEIDLSQQLNGKLEHSQQSIDNQHFEDLMQQNEQLMQQTQGHNDFSQQTSGKLEFGQQTGNTQQLEQFAQRTTRSDDLTKQTQLDKHEFKQHITDNKHLDDLTQQFSQQTEGQLEFGQQIVGNQHSEHSTRQNEQYTQQTVGSNDFTQQSIGKPEFGQQMQSVNKLDNPKSQRLEEFNEQNKDFTQQTGEFNEFTQQTMGHLEFGQPHKFDKPKVDNHHLKDLTQNEDLSQVGGFDDFSQQTAGHLEFGQQREQQKPSRPGHNSQRLEHYSQRNEWDTDNLSQQTTGHLEFGQQREQQKPSRPGHDSQRLEHYSQQNEWDTDNLSQQTAGHLEFGQQREQQKPSSSGHYSQQNEWETDNLSQQTAGHLEFGQQREQQKPNSSGHYSQQNEWDTDNLSQQTAGHLEFGQQREQQKPSSSGHYSQQNEWDTDNLSQQTAGYLEFGQQREQQRPSSSGHYSQQNKWYKDNLSQQLRQYPSYNNQNTEQSEWQLGQMSQQTNVDQDFTQQVDQDRPAIEIKPAPKPKPRPRYQKHDLIPSHTDGTDTNVGDVFKPVEVNPEADIDNFRGRLIESGSRATYPESNHQTNVLFTGSSAFDNQRRNIDSLHGVHNSNDATVGLQWHYTYHPSDLTNVEGSHDNYYPRHNVDSMPQQKEDVQQQSKPFDFNQQETQHKDTLEDGHQTSQSSQHDKYDQQSRSLQQTETSHFDNQFNQESDQTASRVIPLQQNAQLTSEQEKRSTSTTEQTGDKIEPRILQAFGGGPYDASHTDDFYTRVRPNPSATLLPLGGEDPWDIREKPKDVIIQPTIRNTPQIVTTTEAAEITTQTIGTTTQSSFWGRVGHKITNAYDKAKEKAKEIFG